jgi:hypothetical protein
MVMVERRDRTGEVVALDTPLWPPPERVATREIARSWVAECRRRLREPAEPEGGVDVG